MKNLLFFTFLVSCLPDILLAQAPDTLWTKTFGGNSVNYRNDDFGNSVGQTNNGGYIIVGMTNSSHGGGGDMWLIKTYANGDSLWAKTFGSELGNENGYCVRQTSDGGYITVSTTNDGVVLMKHDVYGDTLWAKTFGSGVGYSVQQTDDGGYVITGFTGGYDAWLIRTDANGDTLWTKTIWGNFEDMGYSLQQTSDGGYIIAGGTRSFGTGGYDVWLIRVDADTISNTSINNYQLRQNYPNPFNSITTINYHLSAANFVELAIYNLLGQHIRTLINTQQGGGPHKVQWDGRDKSGKDVSSGVYFYKLEAGPFSETKKMVLLR